jgi:hypothetical protein
MSYDMRTYVLASNEVSPSLSLESSPTPKKVGRDVLGESWGKGQMDTILTSQGKAHTSLEEARVALLRTLRAGNHDSLTKASLVHENPCGAM